MLQSRKSPNSSNRRNQNKEAVSVTSSSDNTQVPPIECKNLWKLYGTNAEKALENVQSEKLDKDACRERFDCVIGVVDASFSVNEGEIFCIMGLSGSGKSTLIRHINRLIEPTAGQVLIDGIDIRKLSSVEMRQLRSDKIGMVFQNMALLPHRNVRENAGFGLEVKKIDKKTRLDAADKALDLVQLTGWGDRYPAELSGGMQQRVGLARALASDPEILLMDEPFSALDPLIRRQLQDQFIDLSRDLKKTTLFITHDLDEAIRLGNRIAIMKDGVLVQIGTPEDIVTQPADDYVADFVAHISRLNLVYAGAVMYSLEIYRSVNPDEDLEGYPTATREDTLNHLAELMVEGDFSKVVIVEDSKTIGVVTRRSLLSGIQGKSMDKLVPSKAR
jgi:glycine betaine/proline transport system ATP-binding protein